MFLRGSLASPATGIFDASPRPGEVFANITEPLSQYAKHDGVFSLWDWAWFIRSDYNTFRNQIAREIFSIAPHGQATEVPWGDVKRRLDSLLGTSSQGISYSWSAAKSRRNSAQSDLRTRNEDWVYFNPPSVKTYNTVTQSRPQPNIGSKNPYVFDANGWLVVCGTSADLEAPEGADGKWGPGFTGCLATIGYTEIQGAKGTVGITWHPPRWGNADDIFARAEAYSILRAVENAWEIRVAVLQAIKAEVDRIAAGSPDWGNLDAWAHGADNPTPVPYDFWVLNEDPTLNAFRAGPDTSAKAWTQPLTSEAVTHPAPAKVNSLLLLAIAAAGLYAASRQ